MISQPMTIIPVTSARGKLGDLTDSVVGEQYVVLTKGGRPRAALVGVEYLTKLQKAVERLYQKTFIDPSLLPFTREFSDEEIEGWLEEDRLI